jgi:signal transduction histidine kinase
VILALRAARLAADPPAPAVSTESDALRAGLNAVSNELRRVVHGVMPALLIELGLYAAAEDLVDPLPVPTRLELTGNDRALSQEVQSTCYFVIAEALTNAVKHSQARHLTVRIRQETGQLQLEVRDDGVGGAQLNGGSGLRGIADRLGALGGRVRVDSDPGHGTRRVAEVPCAS